MMKKSLVLLLALTLAFSAFLVGCTPKEEPVDQPNQTDTPSDQTDNPAEPQAPTEPTGQITIGNTTELSGDWVPYWTNNAADYDVYQMVMGYGTVDMTFGGEYVVNTAVVDKHEVTENEDGSKTYTWTIKDGLTYADGSPITAYDYVAGILLWSSPQVQATGVKLRYKSIFCIRSYIIPYST